MKTCIPDLSYFPNFKDPHSVAVENMSSASSTLLAIYFMACLPAREKFRAARPSDPLNELKMNNSSSRTTETP